MSRILIITERKQSLNGVYSGLTDRGFLCTIASPQEDIEKKLSGQSLDLIILEIDDKHGAELARLLQKIKRKKQLPVMGLINRRVIESPSIDLEAIDDFVMEPGDASELVLRIERLLKKADSAESGEVIRCGDLIIDLAKYEVSISGRRIELTFKEYELLRFLASHPGRVYTRDALLNQVWGYDYFGGDRTVDVHIRRLRSKIEDLGRTFVETVRNIGYRFNCNQ